MSAIRSRDNKTEVALRRALHAAGLRFRLHSKQVLGRPDLIFPREKVAVFVDGDFWHARKVREQGVESLRTTIRTPTQAYWLDKFSRRIKRDDLVTQSLRADGWLVLRYWESDIKASVNGAVDEIASAVLGRRKSLKQQPVPSRRR